ncbi:uncharacterized protein LOC131244357 [Magnolia sinica]|uniref:uncharacterized protein LOC131244357 n=1 Tax=Magnolia sinica TaxID=86752 RepID=UPI0026583558|nr:uncharacterized protein LOC131244357 [Magnolia sinica]
MGFKSVISFALGLILLVLISMPSDNLVAAKVSRGTQRGGAGFGFNRTSQALRNTTIIVGGSEHWHYGFDYNRWAFQNGPFYQNDTLVFKYDPPSNTTFPHSVYLFKNFRSFMKCNLNQSTLVGNVMQGGGDGFKFVLKERKPYLFACGERGGIHCNAGLMKFFVWPLKAPCRG